MVVPNRILLNVLLGVPDSGRDRVRVTPDGKSLMRLKRGGDKTFTLRGSANLMPYLSRERFALRPVYLQKESNIRIRIGQGAILNHIADPDICSGALELAAQLVGKLSRPCFNRPAAVARTSRHDVARMLAGIAGLNVPKTIRVDEPTPSSVRDAITERGLDYPILLRAAGSHGGVSLIKADGPQDVEGVTRLEGVDRALYATEFHDFAGPDGFYRKFRVAVVGEDIFLRHCIIAENWLLHATRRAAGTEEQERAMLASFEREWGLRLRPIFREIGSRLGLDLFGVDCNIDSEGRVLLFEANACMNILMNTSPSPNMWDAPIQRIKSAIEQRLASPSTWYGQAERPGGGR